MRTQLDDIVLVSCPQCGEWILHYINYHAECGWREYDEEAPELIVDEDDDEEDEIQCSSR